MEKKARYHEPEIEVVYFGLEDIITTSGEGKTTSSSSTSQTFNLF